tara:strand:+ start:62 stop:427 length:366 start_codon:yes stop_codon:yes gene_type:complete
MLGTVGLERLKITCIVGIHPHERVEEQDLFIDFSVDIDFGPAAASEDVRHTVDYSEIAAELERMAIERRYQLIETFAEEAAERVFSLYPTVQALRMTIRKPAAVPAAACSLVRIERERAQG